MVTSSKASGTGEHSLPLSPLSRYDLRKSGYYCDQSPLFRREVFLFAASLFAASLFRFAREVFLFDLRLFFFFCRGSFSFCRVVILFAVRLFSLPRASLFRFAVRFLFLP